MEPYDSLSVRRSARLVRERPSRNEAGAATLPTILTLVLGRRERARIVDAFRGRARILDAADVVSLQRFVMSVGPSLAGVILEPRDARGISAAAFVQWCLGYAPGVPLIAYCEAGVDASQDILDLSCAGIHELLFRGVNDDPLRMRAALDAGLRASAAIRTLALVLPHVPSVLHGIVEYTVHHPELATVAAVADGLGMHRKTLVNQCTRVGFPPPGFVIGWSRLLHASVLLSTTRCPVDHIARALAFPSGTALRNMMRRYTSCRPSELRATTGAERLLERFKATTRAADHAPLPRRVLEPTGR